MKKAVTMIWRPKVLQLGAEASPNTGSYSLRFCKQQSLSNLEEVSRFALKDARHCQLSLKCRLSSMMRNLSQSCFHLICSAQRWHKMPINALFVVQISKTSYALLKLNPKEQAGTWRILQVSAFAFAGLVNTNRDFQFLFILNRALQDKVSSLIPLHEWSGVKGKQTVLCTYISS